MADFKRKWADGPLPLIESPHHKLKVQGKTMQLGSSVSIATEMSNLHNIMIRGLNSMILQAPHLVTPTDEEDMIRYAYATCLFIHEHHQTEETLYFPLIEQASGLSGLMQKNVVQHEAFNQGMHVFETYVRQMMNGVAKYDSEKFVAMLDTFASTLTSHLTDEINTLLDLEQYNIDWEPIMTKVAQHAVANVEKVNAVPFFMTNMDTTYEDNTHAAYWPPVPWLARMIFRWIYVPKYKGAWRFASCDPHGKPKELPFAPLKDEAPKVTNALT